MCEIQEAAHLHLLVLAFKSQVALQILGLGSKVGIV